METLTKTHVLPISLLQWYLLLQAGSVPGPCTKQRCRVSKGKHPHPETTAFPPKGAASQAAWHPPPSRGRTHPPQTFLAFYLLIATPANHEDCSSFHYDSNQPRSPQCLTAKCCALAAVPWKNLCFSYLQLHLNLPTILCIGFYSYG